MIAKRIRMTGSILLCAALAWMTPIANADVGGDIEFTDDYVLSPVFIDPNGNKLDADDGIHVYSGEVELGGNGGKQTRGTTTYHFGSSYASTTEYVQYWYTGKAYASGKADFSVPGKPSYQRVTEVCFKYTREGKDVIGWRCSRVTLGPTWSPGDVVSETVRDTLNPVAPKTIFRYSYKAG